MISYREANIVKTSSLESALSQVNAMSPEQIKELVNNKINELGAGGVLNAVKTTLFNLSRPTKAAAMGDQGWTENSGRPSQLKQKMDSGDWLYVLAFLLLVGTAGGADGGSSWSDIFKGFAAASGTAFLGWVFKQISSRKK